MYTPMINRVKSAIAYETNENTIAEIKAIVGEFQMASFGLSIDAEIESIDWLVFRLGKLSQKYRLYHWTNAAFALLYSYSFDNSRNFGLDHEDYKCDKVEKSRCDIGCFVDHNDHSNNHYDLAYLSISNGPEKFCIPIQAMALEVQNEIYRNSAINGSILQRKFGERAYEEYTQEKIDSINELIESVLFAVIDIDRSTFNIFCEADELFSAIMN